MPRLTPERRLRQRERIIDAARLCYVRKGFQATTMADIIREAGLSAGAVYGYFSSKHDLCLAAMERELGHLDAALTVALTPLPGAGLRAAIQQVLAAMTAISDGGETDFRVMALLGLAEARRDPAMHQAMLRHLADFQARLEAMVRHYHPGADPVAGAGVLMSLIFGRLASHTLFGSDLALPLPTLTELGL